jgi:hypothetical protein
MLLHARESLDRSSWIVLPGSSNDFDRASTERVCLRVAPSCRERRGLAPRNELLIAAGNHRLELISSTDPASLNIVLPKKATPSCNTAQYVRVDSASYANRNCSRIARGTRYSVDPSTRPLWRKIATVRLRRATDPNTRGLLRFRPKSAYLRQRGPQATRIEIRSIGKPDGQCRAEDRSVTTNAACATPGNGYCDKSTRICREAASCLKLVQEKACD